MNGLLVRWVCGFRTKTNQNSKPKQQVRDAVAPRGGPGAPLSLSSQKMAASGGKSMAGGGGPVPEALVCVGALAQALQGIWKPYVQQLLEAMMLTGLSETLIRSLAAIADALPELLEDIQVSVCLGG
jgi:hypothetical protein